MELPPDVLDLIDQYVSDALGVTGTRKVPRRMPIVEPEQEPEPEPPTSPELNEFAEEDRYAWQLPAVEIEDDGFVPLPRIRAPRGSAPPPGIELDDEITEVLSKPS